MFRGGGPPIIKRGATLLSSSSNYEQNGAIIVILPSQVTATVTAGASSITCLQRSMRLDCANISCRQPFHNQTVKAEEWTWKHLSWSIAPVTHFHGSVGAVVKLALTSRSISSASPHQLRSVFLCSRQLPEAPHLRCCQALSSSRFARSWIFLSRVD